MEPLLEVTPNLSVGIKLCQKGTWSCSFVHYGTIKHIKPKESNFYRNIDYNSGATTVRGHPSQPRNGKSFLFPKKFKKGREQCALSKRTCRLAQQASSASSIQELRSLFSGLRPNEARKGCQNSAKMADPRTRWPYHAAKQV